MKYSSFPNPDSLPNVRRCRAPQRRLLAVRAGMTLLEVILAITILGGSLAVLGELVRVGTRSARAAQVLSTSQLLADSIVAEITAGITAAESTEGVVDDYGGFRWSYVVQIEQVDQQGLLAVAVTVRENADVSQQPVSYTLVRWMIDPQTERDLETAAAQAASSTSSSSSSGSSSGSSAGSPSSGSSGTTPQSASGTGGSR